MTISLKEVHDLMRAVLLADEACVRHAMEGLATLHLRAAMRNAPSVIGWSGETPPSEASRAAIFHFQKLLEGVPELKFEATGPQARRWTIALTLNLTSSTLQAAYWARWRADPEVAAAKALVAKRLEEALALADRRDQPSI